MEEEKKKTPILGMTDHALRAGFGIQMHNIMNILSEKYDCHFLGWGFRYEEPIRRGNYTLIPTGNDYHGRDSLPFVLNQVKPEVLITQSDTRMINWIPEMFSRMSQKPTWIYYPVIDGHVWNLDNKRTRWPSNWTGTMKAADVVVAFTDFGKRILEANGFSDVPRIYHGVDTTVFRPYMPEEKEQIKASLGIQGKYVVGAVFKNMQRKNPEKHLHALSILKKTLGDKVVGVFHTNPNPTGQGEFNLVQQAIDVGLTVGKDVFFTHTGVPRQVMPQIYNMFDTFWALGGMEGFCIPLIEAMACGIPVVALEGTTFPELLGGTGVLTPVPVYKKSRGCKITYGSYNGVEGLVCDPYDVARKTNMLYKDKTLRDKISFKEVGRAIDTFDWSVIRPQWLDLVSKYVISEEDIPDEWKELYQEVQQ